MPCAPGQVRAARGRLDPRRNRERQRALIADFDPGMLDAKHVERLPGLRQNGIAIVRRDPGLHGDLEAAAVPRLNRHVQVRPHAHASVSSLPNSRRFFLH